VAALPQGDIGYRAAGPRSTSRPPVVFAHGLLTDSRLWEPVAGRLAAEGIRSYAPTLPLGAHRRAMNADADLSPAGVARLLGDFIAALDLDRVTIVGNDTGTAICQLVLAGDAGAVGADGAAGAAGAAGRIGAAVLTNGDAFDAFPPRALAPLFFAGRHPALVAGLLPGLRSDAIRTGRLGFGPLASGPLDAGLTRSWIDPLGERAIRRDLAAFARGVRSRVLLDAADRFGQFTGVVRVVWGDDDAYFPAELGRRLSAAFPRGTLTTVAGGRTFLPLEHPDLVAAEIIAATRDAVPHQR